MYGGYLFVDELIKIGVMDEVIQVLPVIIDNCY